jgi:hypothetical protein
MYACVAETREEEPTSRVMSGRTITRVVTNDAMRDHWNDLLPPMPFRRWRHSQVAAFGQPPATGPEKETGNEDDAAKASNSREEAPDGIQRTANGVADALSDAENLDRRCGDTEEAVAPISWVAPVPSISVETQGEAGQWHVPIPDTCPQKWLCIDLTSGMTEAASNRGQP